jgi:hypothetical protein
MRFSWLVILIATFPLFAGCGTRDPMEGFDQFAPMEGCVYMDELKERAYLSSAEKFFLREVGVKIASHKIARPSVCKEEIVVPVVAITEHSNVPKIWFVKIGRSDNSFRLGRPD